MQYSTKFNINVEDNRVKISVMETEFSTYSHILTIDEFNILTKEIMEIFNNTGDFTGYIFTGERINVKFSNFFKITFVISDTCEAHYRVKTDDFINLINSFITKRVGR